MFTLQRQKKVCTPGDEAIMKIHKQSFSGIPFNFTLFIVSPKLQRILSWNFGFAIRKIWAFIWYQTIYYFRLSPRGWECDRHKVLYVCFHTLSFFRNLTRPSTRRPTIFKQNKRARKREKIERWPPREPYPTRLDILLSTSTPLLSVHL